MLEGLGDRDLASRDAPAEEVFVHGEIEEVLESSTLESSKSCFYFVHIFVEVPHTDLHVTRHYCFNHRERW